MRFILIKELSVIHRIWICFVCQRLLLLQAQQLVHWDTLYIRMLLFSQILNQSLSSSVLALSWCGLYACWWRQALKVPRLTKPFLLLSMVHKLVVLPLPTASVRWRRSSILFVPLSPTAKNVKTYSYWERKCSSMVKVLPISSLKRAYRYSSYLLSNQPSSETTSRW